MNIVHLWCCWPWSLGEGDVCQVFPLPFWKEVTVLSPRLQSGEPRPISWRPEYLHKVFCVFLYGRFVLFSSCVCAAIYLYQQGLNCFILWVIVRYYLLILLLKLFQLWPLGAFSVGSCVPLTSLSIDRLIDWILFSFLPLQKCSRHFWGCFRLVWVFPGCSAYSSTLPALLEPQVPSLGQEDPLEKELATHPSILDWEIPCTLEPSGLQSMGWQKSWTQLSN